MLNFIDTHLHLQDFKSDFAPQIATSPLLKKAILISASANDFKKIEQLIKTYPSKFIPAFGIHPWYASEPFNQEELISYLKKYPNALVGEIGVDRLKEAVTPKQHTLFTTELNIAKTYNRPVIVHAAKAFNDLIEHKNELKEVTFCHHGFVKNKELIKFINDCNGYFGLGALFLKQEQAKEMLALMPKDKILFETDAPFRVSDEKYLTIVEENLNKLSSLIGKSLTETIKTLNQNMENFIKC